MNNNKLVMPVFKWVGGKRQLLNMIKPLLPGNIATYCEPFVGGGALLFDLQPDCAYINDINAELINVYMVIKNNIDELIAALKEFKNDAEQFYSVRSWDRDKSNYSKMSAIDRAARMLYLNKTCYNGLYRVNSSGEFNSPFGKYSNPNIVNEPVIRAVSSYLNTAAVNMSYCDYAEVLDKLPQGPDTFVYLDPPYDPVSGTANFTGYTNGGFSHREQIRLRECCDRLTARGNKFLLSNSATEFIRGQYTKYNIMTVQAKRAINSVASKRGNVDEVLVCNY